MVRMEVGSKNKPYSIIWGPNDHQMIKPKILTENWGIQLA